MADNLTKQQQWAIESAQGYLLLDLPDAALRELSVFGDDTSPESAAPPFSVSQLRGEAFRAKEQYDVALKHFERVRPQAETDCQLLMSMAWCFKRVGRLDQAIEAMRAAYASSPKEPIVLYNLACYFSLAGEVEEALSWLGRAFRMDKNLRKLVAAETDFDPIRDDPRFADLLRLAEPKSKS